MDSVSKILVVDDNEANRSLVRETLEGEGYEIVEATGGSEGVAAFERTLPDCVLLDVHMPDLDGFAVCERIRSHPSGPETPIVFLTALRDVDTFDRALRAGADDFLTKPVRPTEIVVRVQAALKLRKMSRALREHYELLKRQRDDLLRVQLEKERITAFVVHDLKNPVNAMDLHAQVILRDRTLPESAHESARHIRAAARQLHRMIYNLLDVAKADEGALAPHRVEVDLRLLVREVVDELAVSAEAREVTLETVLDGDRAFVDEDLLRRALTNLVENAIRYAPSGSVVRIVARREPGGVELRVVDAGRGVPPEMRQRIFEPFAQADAEERARAGRGLGLTFCKRMAEAHGGRIWIEDAAPGSAFCLKIPDAA